MVAAATLRLARVEDAGTIAFMSRDLIEHGLGWRYSPARVARLLRDPDTIALVACKGPAIVGFSVMQFGDETAHLLLLAVRASRRRSGVARSLLDWLFASAQVAGIAEVRLELRADNPGALAFYRQCGFVERERVAGYYSGRLDAVRMALVFRATVRD
jgi:ribosomal-protein-alanine N-acetyltransferase